MYRLDMSKSATIFNSKNALPQTKSLIAELGGKLLLFLQLLMAPQHGVGANDPLLCVSECSYKNEYAICTLEM